MGAGPIHSFQSSVSGAVGGSFGRSTSTPCGQTGLFVHAWTSFIWPSTPAATHSETSRRPSPEWPWLPICVTTLCFRAVSVISRASHTAWAIGFCT